MDVQISIHALRVEGDYHRFVVGVCRFGFLSTPSGWRATLFSDYSILIIYISIHALRVEGDLTDDEDNHFTRISIHALRVEGDSKNGQSFRLFLRKREKNLPL